MKLIYALAMASAMLFSGVAWSESFSIENLRIEHAWARTTVGQGKTSAVYLTIKNTGAADDALIGVQAEISGRAELHKTDVKDSVASMRHIDGARVPAGESLELAPGGFHIMLMELHEAIREHDTLKVTLIFEKAGEAEIIVKAVSAGSMKH